MKKKEHGVNEGIDDLTDLDAHQFAEPDTDTAVKPASAKQAAADRRRRLQDIEDRRAEKDDWFSGKDAEPNVRIHRAKYQDEPEELDEYTQAEYDQAIGDFKAKGGRTQQLPPGKAKNPISTASRHIAGRGEAGKGKPAGRGAKVTADGKPVVDVYEKAPPGAKAERMVKHIKQDYAKDGKLTKKEKGIAYATAWKAHNKGNVEEGVDFKDTIKNSTPKLSKIKAKMVKESLDVRNHPIYTTQEAWDHYAKELAEQEGQGEQYVVCIIDYSQSGQPIVRRTAPVEKAKADEILANAKAKDKFTNPLYKTIYPASEGKLSAEQIMQKFPDMAKEAVVDASQELDEIAKLAGLKTEMNNKIPGDSDSPLTHANACPVCETAPCSCEHEEELDERETFASMPKTTTPVPAAPAVKPASYDKSKLNPMEEEEMGEGNEFSGALAAAKASGAKEFEVGGKKYTVKEDINVNITANGEEDALNLIRKLSGMAEVHAEPVVAVGEDVEEGPKERDIEHTNSPREEQAGADASFPGGNDLNRPKKSYSDKPFRGDNPMAVQEAKEEALWKAYESMIKDVKK